MLSEGAFMTDFESLASGKPVPPVNADDLKRVWYAISNIAVTCQSTEGHDPHRTMGIDTRLLEPHCEPGADVTAVSIRALLLHSCLQAGLLDDWREANGLRDTVFRVAATYPIEQGRERFNFPGFVERLRQ